MTRSRRRRIAWLAAMAVVAVASIAAARPGGGESFSGGGGHSGGGGSSGGGGGDGGLAFELIYWGFQLIFYYPAIGLPLLGLIIAVVVWSAYKQRQNGDWDSGPSVELQRTVTPSRLRDVDSDFSQVVFEDFAFRLFSTAQRARSTGDDLAAVAPYVSENARRSLAQRPPAAEPIVQVIVGALRIVRVDIPDEAQAGRVRIAVEFEANVATAAHTYYSVETWVFGRDASRHSKPPSAARSFPCPNCGAPWQSTATGTQQCASCNQVVDNGRFDWVVEDIALASQTERAPSLTAEVNERGTDLPTYKASDRDAQWEALVAEDPAVTEATFEARLNMIYGRLNQAWSANDLTPVRGLVSDGLYDYLGYWVDAYKRQGLRNQLSDMRITAVEYAKVNRDRWYDAVTIRIWGTGKDFVVKSAVGSIVRGSKHFERRYSEYWTLIRSAARRGAAKAEPACGNCGAPLAITMAGACEHCGAYLASGEFDWVLSKIEQDDTYRN